MEVLENSNHHICTKRLHHDLKLGKVLSPNLLTKKFRNKSQANGAIHWKSRCQNRWLQKETSV